MMRFSPNAAGGLRLLVSIAARSTPAAPWVALDELEEATGLHGAAFELVVVALARGGWIEGGPDSGLRLLADPAAINLGAVAVAIDAPALAPEPSDDPRLAHLERTLTWARNEVERFLGQYTLEQMLPGPRTDPATSAAPRRRRSRAHLRLVR